MKLHWIISCITLSLLLAGSPAYSQSVDCPGPGCPLGPANSSASNMMLLGFGAGIFCGDANCKKKSGQPPKGSQSLEEGKVIQSALNYFGFNSGVADGLFGPRTRSAIVAYQSDIGLPVTGYLTQLQIRELVGNYDKARSGTKVDKHSSHIENQPATLPAIEN